ncbi:unnamed protein product [uncultured bacterium]|nr:unnamed protein product [uncultured bacterium]
MMSEGREMHWQYGQGRGFTAKYRVVTDDANDGPYTVMKSAGFKFGDRYNPGPASEADRSTFATSFNCDAVDGDPCLWIVTVGYGPWDANQVGNPDANPLNNPIDVSWGFREYAEVLTRDLNGRLVRNTAGDPFDPPVEYDDPRLMLTVIRNEPSLPLTMLPYRNAINSDPFAGFDPYFAKALPIQAKNLWHQDAGWYYEVTYQFEFLVPKIGGNVDGYRKKILSQGYRAISVVSGKQYHVTYKGIPVNSPVLLDSNGFTLGLYSDPYFIDTPAYPELPFSAFGFDTTAISGQRTGLDYSPTYSLI